MKTICYSFFKKIISKYLTCAVSHNRDLIFIAAKTINIFIDPFQSKHLIFQAHITGKFR